MRFFLSPGLLGGFLLATQSFCPAADAPLDAALQTVRAVGPEGQGNAAAGAAWKQLAAADASALPALLKGMDGANDFAANWLRAAVDSVASRELSAGRPLPLADLGGFLANLRHNPRARRLAYELIAQGDPATAERLLPGMLNDPSMELRRDAVQRLINEADRLQAARNTNGAVLLLQQALANAREVDQIEASAKSLKTLGRPVDLPQVFGWVTNWKVIGPFDNSGGIGFAKAYPPEAGIDLSADYEGKTGKVRWQDLRARNDYGMVDLNQPYTPLKGVTGYAYNEFFASEARPAEIRLGCKNGWKVWFNGKLLFGRDEYHRGIEIDQYRLPVQLQPGRNTLLVKVCQNEQKEDWTVEWEFQLRVTDPLGTPIASSR